MTVRCIPCGDYVTESEKYAVQYLSSKLQNPEVGEWILLSNLHHSFQYQRRSEEIDLIAIGPTGVHVIEIKHWNKSYLSFAESAVNDQAERINDKAKKVAGKVRKDLDPGFVPACFLLTQGKNIQFESGKRPAPRGIEVFGLVEWEKMLHISGTKKMDVLEIHEAARILEPSIKILEGDLRTFAGLIHLERVSEKSDAFHRVYRGEHAVRKDRAILHLYDLSVQGATLESAKREFNTIQLWQKSIYLPNLLDSFQEAPAYPGELHFFTLSDSEAPTLEKRNQDKEWNLSSRIDYAKKALSALLEFHSPTEGSGQPKLLHRSIHPKNLRVQANGLPLFTDFRWAKLQDSETISTSTGLEFGEMKKYVAPEILSGGLNAATTQSDLYSLCASLATIFDLGDPISALIKECLQKGRQDNPEDRPSLTSLIAELSKQSQPIPPQEPKMLPEPKYWSEGTIVEFRNSRYKILNKLGEGGIGLTFKVVELGQNSEEKFGTYVAKVVRNGEDGEHALQAYRHVRTTTHLNLSIIYEIASKWEERGFVALFKWVEGEPMHHFKGVLSIYAEDSCVDSEETLAKSWLLKMCDALEALHNAGLVHGDVSPKNILVQGEGATLIDYDTVVRTGQLARSSTFFYSSSSVQSRLPIYPTDDFYALAASFFHVLYDREPFLYGEERYKQRGCNWENLLENGTLRAFLEKATNPDPKKRFQDAKEAKAFLNDPTPKWSPSPIIYVTKTAKIGDHETLWLSNLLSAYPGSHHGNQETRGLDSEFARNTYIETDLDALLLGKVKSGKINLVILFGNAGDGKTAFLQHMLESLGIKNTQSSKRVWEHQLSGNQRLRINLDGSAAWENQSANELLDEFFLPFRQENYVCQDLHIVAINSGKLLEWASTQPEENYLTEQLRSSLLSEQVELDPRFLFIDLNWRSLVGGIGDNGISTYFLDSMLDRLLGNHLGDQDPWRLCKTCTANLRCTAWHSVSMLRDPALGPRIRKQLHYLFQACHQRGKVHITARGLRATLSYVFFGIYDCKELHAKQDLTPEFYFQRAFDAFSSQRQGELLGEFVKIDPALEADPILDRVLLKNLPEEAPPVQRLIWSRRRAYFEGFSLSDLNGAQKNAVFLVNGKHLALFRDFSFRSESEQKLLCQNLCLGIAKRKPLPFLAFKEQNLRRGVPLPLTPRTKTETKFWVIKPWERFFLRAPKPFLADGLEVLPTQLQLCYQYVKGGEEVLNLSLDLFSLLLDLKEGVQFSGGQESVFAHLEVFTQRLSQEDASEMYGHHPIEEDSWFRLYVEERDSHQYIVREVEK
ncbi:conserved hypothetical protein [Gammaproteobacteria bacterium]